MRTTENKLQEGFKTRVGTALCAFASDRSGATAVEYGILAATLCAVVVAAVTALSGGIETIFGRIAGYLG